MITGAIIGVASLLIGLVLGFVLGRLNRRPRQSEFGVARCVCGHLRAEHWRRINGQIDDCWHNKYAIWRRSCNCRHYDAQITLDDLLHLPTTDHHHL